MALPCAAAGGLLASHPAHLLTAHVVLPAGHFEDQSPSVVLLAKAGTPLLFDYRVRHRGLANRSNTPRPLLYVTFAKANYQDKVRAPCPPLPTRPPLHCL